MEWDIIQDQLESDNLKNCIENERFDVQGRRLRGSHANSSVSITRPARTSPLVKVFIPFSYHWLAISTHLIIICPKHSIQRGSRSVVTSKTFPNNLSLSIFDARSKYCVLGPSTLRLTLELLTAFSTIFSQYYEHDDFQTPKVSSRWPLITLLLGDIKIPVFPAAVYTRPLINKWMSCVLHKYPKLVSQSSLTRARSSVSVHTTNFIAPAWCGFGCYPIAPTTQKKTEWGIVKGRPRSNRLSGYTEEKAFRIWEGLWILEKVPKRVNLSISPSRSSAKRRFNFEPVQFCNSTLASWMSKRILDIAYLLFR